MNKKLITTILIVAVLIVLGTLYYFLDYQNNLKIKEQTKQSEFMICQGNYCVDFSFGELLINKTFYPEMACVDAVSSTFCGSFMITRNK